MKTRLTSTPKMIEWAIKLLRDVDQPLPRHRMTRPLGMLMCINMPALMTHSRKGAAV
jgi:hypothetical protein